MPAVVPYTNPQEAARALIKDHAKTKYGIEDADALKELADMMYDKDLSPELRLKCIQTALKYTHTEVKSSHVEHSGTVDHNHQHRVDKAIDDYKEFMREMRRERMKLVQKDENIIDLHPEPVEESEPSGPDAS